MATDTAELIHRKHPAPDPAQNAWQIPLFLVGAAVFVSAWQGWLPLGTPDPAADFTRDLAALRNSYEKVSPDRDELKDLLTKVAAGVDSFPEHAAMARFILGSGYVRLAELTPNLDEARNHWILAKQHFERVRAEDLKDPSDPPRLTFRAAKARAAVGLPANVPVADVRLQIALLGNAPFGEESGEAGRLQADLALRLTPPDLTTAKESLTRYLTTTGIATPAASLARAKYLLGDIHFRRKEPDLARKWLEQIGSDAPVDVIAPARFLLARVRVAENKDWLGAIRDLEAVRATPTAGAALKASAAYHLGFCKLNTLELDAAAKAFEEAVKAEPPEGIAAAARLAELDIQSADPAKHIAAVGLLASAVKGIKDGKEFRNPLIRVSEVRGTFEMAIAALLKDGAYEAAVKAADAYAAICEVGKDRELRADALAAWATTLQKSGGDYKPRALAAAEEYKGLVALQPGVTAKADQLRRAAALYKLGGNTAAAVAVLQEATKLQLPDTAIGPVWAELADALLAADRPAADVLKAFNEAMAAAVPVSTTIRYRLARQFADGRDPRLAPLSRDLFRQIAEQTVSPSEQEFHERAMVELAHDSIRSANFPEAEVWLRKQLSSYPNGAEAPLGRLLLGVCLIQRASATLPSPPDVATATRLRDEALKSFKQIVAEADDKLKRDGKLSERDAWLRREAGLRVLQTYLQMKKPNDLLAEADKLRERHRNSVEELIILSLIYHAFKQKGDVVRERQIRDQMKELFDRLPASAFNREQGEYSRAYWEKVWFTPDK